MYSMSTHTSPGSDGPIFPRHPGCNVWMPSDNGSGRRCGDLSCDVVVHLCPSCAVQAPPETAGEREALIAEWVSMLDPEGWPEQDHRDQVSASLRGLLPPIAGLRALVERHRRYCTARPTPMPHHSTHISHQDPQP